MTIVNNTYRFIYLHVPKTGGTSLKLYLDRFSRSGDICLTKGVHSEPAHGRKAELRKHSSARDVSQYLGAAEFDRYFRFSVVRNPFERANSIFHFLKFKFRSWPKSRIMDRFETVDDLVVSRFFRQPGPGGIFEPQTSWLMLDGQVAVNFLARLETLDADMATIFRRLSLGDQPPPIERRNVSRPVDNDAHSLLAPAAVDSIRRRYAADFEALGYSPDPPDLQLSMQEFDRGVQ
jgi:hypothetical protein